MFHFRGISFSKRLHNKCDKWGIPYKNHYNYNLCNQCISPFKLWVRITLMVYSIQHNVIKLLVTCHWSVVCFWYSVSSTNKTGRHDITEILLILLRVVLNTTAPIHIELLDVKLKYRLLRAKIDQTIETCWNELHWLSSQTTVKRWESFSISYRVQSCCSYNKQIYQK